MNTTRWDGEQGDPSDLLYRLEVAELARPHIVVTRDVRNDRVSFAGPYPSAVEALCAADTECQVNKDLGNGDLLTFHVAALYPPLVAPEPEPGAGIDLGQGLYRVVQRPVSNVLLQGFCDLVVAGRDLLVRWCGRIRVPR